MQEVALTSFALYNPSHKLGSRTIINVKNGVTHKLFSSGLQFLGHPVYGARRRWSEFALVTCSREALL